MFLIYGIVGILLTITYFGRNHGALCFNLAFYYCFPFEKFIVIQRTIPASEVTPLFGSDGNGPPDHSLNNMVVEPSKKRECSCGYIIWKIFACLFCFFFHFSLFFNFFLC